MTSKNNFLEILFLKISTKSLIYNKNYKLIIKN